MGKAIELLQPAIKALEHNLEEAQFWLHKAEMAECEKIMKPFQKEIDSYKYAIKILNGED